MNKRAFLSRLEELLYDLPEEERESALQYYEDYFEEAGPDMEFQVIRDLGSPERIAAIIKTNLIREVENRNTDGEFTEHGYSTPEFDEKQNFVVVGNEIIYEEVKEEPKNQETIREDDFRKEVPKGERQGASYSNSYNQHTYEEKKNREIVRKENRKLTGKTIVLILLLVLVGLPIVFGIAISAVGTIFGFVMSIVTGILAILLAGFILSIVGIGLAGVGIVQLFMIPIVGVSLVGAGLFCFGIGLILSWLTIKLWKIGTPYIIAFFKNIWYGKNGNRKKER